MNLTEQLKKYLDKTIFLIFPEMFSVITVRQGVFGNPLVCIISSLSSDYRHFNPTSKIHLKPTVIAQIASGPSSIMKRRRFVLEMKSSISGNIVSCTWN